MNSMQRALFLATILPVFATPAIAQIVAMPSSGPTPITISSSDEISGGKSWNRELTALGVEAADAELEFNYRLAYSYNESLKIGLAEGSVDGDLHLEIFGHGGDVASAEFESYAQDTIGGGASGSYSAKVRVAGMTVYSKTGSTTVDLSKSFSGDYTQKWLSASETFMLGPIPVKVTLSASSSAEFSVQGGIKPVSLSAGIDGEVELVPGSVSASAGIGFDVGGVVGASAGIRADLDFAKLTLKAAFEAKATSGFSGYLKYTLDAMTLELKLFAEAHVLFVKKEYDLTILDKTWGSTSDTISF